MKMSKKMSGAFIMLNNEDKKMLIGTSDNIIESNRTKELAIQDYIKRRRKYCNVSDVVQKDIDKRDGDIFDEVYIITYDKREVMDVLASGINNIKGYIKLFIDNDLFDEYESYSYQDYLLKERALYLGDLNRKRLYELIYKRVIRMFKYEKNSKNTFEEINPLKIIKNKGDVKVLNGSEIKTGRIEENIDKNIKRVSLDNGANINHIEVSKELRGLLEVESIIEGKSIEDIIRDRCISSKSIMIRDMFK